MFAEKQIPINCAIALIYIGWLLTTPYNSPTMSFLADIRFERIIAGILLIGVLFTGNLSKIFSIGVASVLCLFLFMTVSYSLSDYYFVPSAITWREDYWKLILFYLLLTCSILKLDDLRFLVKGMVIIVLFYQVLSWRDFLSGGGYVYQQGIKRMVGIWSGGGLGAANAWASLNLFSIPFSVATFKESKRPWEPVLYGFAISLSVLSILSSGTRGALICLIGYVLLFFGSNLFKPKYLILGTLVIAVTISVLPEKLRYRYWNQVFLFSEESGETDKSSDEVAKQSLEGRTEGFWDGISLANKYPLLGSGPGSSAYARLDLNDSKLTKEPLQLHNLYGQVLGELGYIGGGIWIGAIWINILIMNSIAGRRNQNFSRNCPNDQHQRKIYLSSLNGGFCVMLIYGLASHNLYDERWIILLAFSSVLPQLLNDNSPDRELENEELVGPFRNKRTLAT